MPEGDAVYRTAARLRAALDGRPLVRSDFRVPRYATTDLSGRTVLTTVSYGKHLLTRIDGGLTVHTHLRMDGSWWIQPAGRRLPPGDVVRLVLANAERQAVGVRLGVVELLPTEHEDRVIGHLGPDLLGPNWDPEEAARRMRRRPEETIGEALLDQRNLAGIGTIWRAETLFLAGVSPWRPVGECTGLAEMVARTARLMKRAAEQGRGPVTTGDPRPGRELWVYGRDRRPCRRCGTAIARGEMGSRPYERLVFYCPVCQPW
ncbi:putative endonuclease 8 2 [Thermopolyspora flexuosa]|uniref:DNA-(apurinic or apyrimidinic site) lyase n=1 Tax=Thermopolyspora flexuosa TaxID=103836 RepID=A0A543J0R2_9ACTN|nr:DNA-formamidopyrimidine glycosylase family protein [Thermopolyspora flexuosa]TQM76412.1 endonuclease-8 [Thermopolyspora flexuosa]GGM67318.1 putative endonuclease 8 2 [Thermopolyspora flexuosa]